jgi:DNA-binding transcriptional LysR family regulator
LGIAFLSTWLAAEELKTGKLETLAISTRTEDVPIFALWPRSRDLSPKVRVVVDALVNTFMPVAPWDTSLM